MLIKLFSCFFSFFTISLLLNLPHLPSTPWVTLTSTIHGEENFISNFYLFVAHPETTDTVQSWFLFHISSPSLGWNVPLTVNGDYSTWGCELGFQGPLASSSFSFKRYTERWEWRGIDIKPFFYLGKEGTGSALGLVCLRMTGSRWGHNERKLGSYQRMMA